VRCTETFLCGLLCTIVGAVCAESAAATIQFLLSYTRAVVLDPANAPVSAVLAHAVWNHRWALELKKPSRKRKKSGVLEPAFVREVFRALPTVLAVARDCPPVRVSSYTDYYGPARPRFLLVNTAAKWLYSLKSSLYSAGDKDDLDDEVRTRVALLPPVVCSSRHDPEPSVVLVPVLVSVCVHS
jgi:hypothetical protein